MSHSDESPNCEISLPQKTAESILGVMLVPIMAPTLRPEEHKHDFHQFLYFRGGELRSMELKSRCH